MSPAYFYTTAFSFFIGVAAALLTPLSYWFAILLAIVAFGILGYARLYSYDRRTKTASIFLLIILAGTAIGVARAQIASDSLGDKTLERYTGSEVVMRGTVTDERDERADYARLELSATELISAGGTETHKEGGLSRREAPPLSKLDAGVLVRAPRYPVYRYGDVVTVEGRLEKPRQFQTETGRTFHYETFLAKEGISYTVSYPRIQRVSTDGGNPVIGAIFDLKQAFLDRINRALDDPQSALAGGILLGTKQSLGERWERLFRDTGLIHIVVLSGYNVTVVAIAITTVLSWAGLGIRSRTVIGLLAIAVFAVMVGLGATVVRASLMAGLVILARALGRRFNIHRALVIAAAVMVLINPLVLVYDPSFQLSFIATLGLVYITPLIEPAFRWVTSRGDVRDIITATISTQIAVLPLLLYMTGSFSLVAIPVNLLVLPIVAAAMFTAFVSGLAMFVSAVAATPLVMITSFLLRYIFIVVETFAALPLAHVTLPPFPIWVPIALYMLAAALLGRYYASRGFTHSSVLAQKIATADR